jgi:oligopeptide/dipeptide ABC transporter ATP-binding protein
MAAYLSIEGVGITFNLRKSATPALVGVDLKIQKGEFVSIIGHSGCSKSTLLNIVAGLLKPTLGGVFLESKLVDASGPDRAVVFQNHSLLPWLTVYQNVRLAVDKVFGKTRSEAERDEWTLHNLNLVGMSHAITKHPSEISGGMKQRVGIARAFAGNPKVVIADEPVSALDVSVQAAVTQLLMEIQRRNRTTLLFISHDLSLVRYLADRVVVMYLGTIAEQGTTDEVFAPPYHPYTEALLSAIPIADTSVEKKHIVLEGDIPSAVNPPPGCPFQTRCPRKLGRICEEEEPPIRVFGRGHRIACHIAPEDLERMEPVIVLAGKEPAD